MNLSGVKGVFLREMFVLRGRIVKTILASSVSPLLFMLAFGYGIGRGADLDGVSYIAFLLPGLIAMSSMNQSYGISTEINISRFYFKVFDEYLLAPVKRWEIVAGEMFYGCVKGFIPVVIILIYACLTGNTMIPGTLFFLSISMHMMTFSLLGLVVALIVKNHGDQFAVNTFVITPMVFLSGTFYPVDKMPVVIKYLAMTFPLTYSTKLIRYSLLGGEMNPLPFVVALAAIMTVFFAVALIVVRKVEA